MQVEQEFSIGVEFRRCAELLHNLLRLDRMDAHPLHTGVFESAVLDQPGYEGYGSHLAHQRRVEANLVDAVHDVPGGCRHTWAARWIDGERQQRPETGIRRSAGRWPGCPCSRRPNTPLRRSQW